MGWLILFLALAVDAAPDAGVANANNAPKSRGFDQRWSHVATPLRGPARAIGLPGAGCVQGAIELPVQGTGWQVVHPERHRQFGHPALLAYLRSLAVRSRREKLGLLYVGDMGQPRGGPTPTGHRSHQNGLDVDLWYGPPDKPWTPGKAPAPAAPSVADLRTHKMLPAWGPKVARLIESAAMDPSVDRIFVNPAIKRALCQDKTRRGPWLQKVRPWWGHQDHLHVRLLCPADNPDCTEAQPLPPGEGCDNLDWWFSEDARSTAVKRGPPGENAPSIPASCEAVLGTDS